MKSIFLIAVMVFAGWALWRGFEAYQFNRLLSTLDGEITESGLRAFMDRLSAWNVPNARGNWDRLRALEQRVMGSSGVGSTQKAEFRTLLESKGIHF